jgi:hypothetical protein
MPLAFSTQTDFGSRQGEIQVSFRLSGQAPGSVSCSGRALFNLQKSSVIPSNLMPGKIILAKFRSLAFLQFPLNLNCLNKPFSH